jgi:hypothetical protein
MTQKLQSAYIASTIIEKFYDKLREISCLQNEDSSEYTTIINKLKKSVIAEDMIYDELSLDEATTAYNKLNENKTSDPVGVRMRYKLSQAIIKKQNTSINIELSNMISSKIIIDVLKRVTLKIAKLSETAVGEGFIDILLLYNDIYKYSYLTSNSYIEKLALEYEYDILSLPDIHFSDVEKKYGILFVKESSNIALNYIEGSIRELLDMRTDDEHLKVYVMILEVSRIEVMLPYLNKESLILLSSYLNNLNITPDNDMVFKKIKKLLNKRKEELE